MLLNWPLVVVSKLGFWLCYRLSHNLGLPLDLTHWIAFEGLASNLCCSSLDAWKKYFSTVQNFAQTNSQTLERNSESRESNASFGYADIFSPFYCCPTYNPAATSQKNTVAELLSAVFSNYYSVENSTTTRKYCFCLFSVQQRNREQLLFWLFLKSCI